MTTREDTYLASASPGSAPSYYPEARRAIVTIIATLGLCNDPFQVTDAASDLLADVISQALRLAWFDGSRASLAVCHDIIDAAIAENNAKR